MRFVQSVRTFVRTLVLQVFCAKYILRQNVRKKSQILSDSGLFPAKPYNSCGGDKRDRTADLLNAIHTNDIALRVFGCHRVASDVLIFTVFSVGF